MKKVQSSLGDSSMQMSLFNDENGVDINEAPEGFYAQLKVYKGYNVCRDCDARKLCQENTDDWCLKNRCSSYEIVAFKDGKTYRRKDGKDVVFKRRLVN